MSIWRIQESRERRIQNLMAYYNMFVMLYTFYVRASVKSEYKLNEGVILQRNHIKLFKTQIIGYRH